MDETKYINANDFREYLLSLKKDVPAGVKAYITGKSISDLLEDFPAADVQAVKHGRWMWECFNIYCSVCDYAPAFDSTELLYNYCPNCGARMTEVEE